MSVESDPVALIDLSAAQRHVLASLKRLGEASAEELAEVLVITPSAVRQHLTTLRSLGLAESRQERGRRGRPLDVYHATKGGEALFSRAAHDLSVELLSDIAEEDPDLLQRVFERRRLRRVERVRTQLSGSSFDERVASLSGILDAEGYMADFERLDGGSYRVNLHTCAIWEVASRYGQACVTELEFLKELLPEAEVARVEHKVMGSYVCGYELSYAGHKSVAQISSAIEVGY